MLPRETQVVPLHNCVELFPGEEVKPAAITRPGLSGEVQSVHIQGIGAETNSGPWSSIISFSVLLLQR